jgi:hypothetical protein
MEENIPPSEGVSNANDQDLSLAGSMKLCLLDIRTHVQQGIVDDGHYADAQRAFQRLKEMVTPEQLQELWRLARAKKEDPTNLYHYLWLLGREMDRRWQARRRVDPRKRANDKAYRAEHKAEHTTYMQTWRANRRKEMTP